ncbi:MAG: CapA family protein [Anaerolineales bacterium]|jgi:poly-gamma-glutamate synthesis protein (capsule biosynthesis protein)
MEKASKTVARKSKRRYRQPRAFAAAILSGLSLIFLAGCSLSALLQLPTPTVDLPAALTALSENTTQMPEEIKTLLPTPMVTEPPRPTATSPEPEAEVDRLWVAPYLPETFLEGVVVPNPVEQVENREEANLILSAGMDGVQVTNLIYALAAPFPALEEGVSLETLKSAWQGNPSGSFSGGHLFLTNKSLAVFSDWWGDPAGDFVRVVEETDLMATVWEQAPAWTLLPFEQLSPEWKVLKVGGQSPLWKSFDPVTYALRVPVRIRGQNQASVDQLAVALQKTLPEVLNRDPNRLTTVVLTGVTALVRATATEMEANGVLYPGGDVAPLMQEADIAHISNEVPFAQNCPPPQPVSERLIFCSADKYIELLDYIGTDVVELTGDHFSDWGIEATLHTFDMYDEYGWAYYGGGRTPDEGRKPITFEHNGNKIAFIGCNGKGGAYAPSTRGEPGAVDCDFNLITNEIARLKQEGYVVVMTFQHLEVYSFYPSPYMVTDFERTARAGADIVSGSQAHHPHGVSFVDDSLIMYGLGNFFFDQLLISENTARAMFARHVIYNGRHISTEIFTIHFLDFSRPRYLEGNDRNDLLREVYRESTWGDLIYAISYNN